MSRKDNLSVGKIDAFNARQHLTRGDVKIMRSSVLCSFRRSKSNQLNERVHKVLALAMPCKILDPKLAVERAFAVSPHARSSDPAFMIPSVKGLVPLTHYVFHKVLALAMPGKILDPKLAVERAFSLSPHARSSDPAFMIPSTKGLVPLTHYVFVGGLKHCLRAIGVDASLYSGHSFRRGGATYAHRLGVDPMLIKRMSDWRSDAYMLYIDRHTPEGLGCLPAAMTQSCAALG